MGSKVNGVNQIQTAECHPEKAGVGGSIPSLATADIRRSLGKGQTHTAGYRIFAFSSSHASIWRTI